MPRILIIVDYETDEIEALLDTAYADSVVASTGIDAAGNTLYDLVVGALDDRDIPTRTQLRTEAQYESDNNLVQEEQ